jgi:hypothetical protein
MNHSNTALSTVADYDSDLSPEITYRLATTHEELEAAFALVWDAYTEVGLHKSDNAGIRFTKYHLLPDTQVFIAVANQESRKAGKICMEEKVIGTLSVVHDGCLGLPAEEVSKDQIISIRNQGGRLAEFIALASDQEGTDNRVTMKLFRLAYEFCRTNGITEIVASLTKHHIGFYRRFMGFRPLGELKEYTMANGIPVQVHQLPVEEASSLIEKRSTALFSDHNWRFFWEYDAENTLMEAKRMRPWDQEKIQYFSSRHPSFLELIDISAAGALSLEYERLGCEFMVAL